MEKRKLAKISEMIESSDKITTLLYVVTRKIKQSFKATAKVLDKYDFFANRIDLSEALVDYFKSIVSKQLAFAFSREDIEICEYSVIDDDLPNRIYTYALNNALSFSKVLTEQLIASTSIPPVTRLPEIKDSLWAYCIKTSVNGTSFYSFRKSSKGKVTTDQPQSKLSKMMAFFDSSDAELKPLLSDTISFDDKIDCIYLDEKFYVFTKSAFENMVGIEDELRENAETVVAKIINTELVVGLMDLKEQMMESRLLLKMLSSIARKQNHEGFDGEGVEKMKLVLKQMEGRDLKVNEDGRIELQNMKDVKDFVKLLNDYYKQGLVSGCYYGTNSGKIINPSE